MIQLSNNGFTLMDEGEYVFRVKSVTYKPDFGKMTVVLERKDGQTIFNTYNFNNGQGILNAFSYFARIALGDTHATEIDEQSLVGKYIRGKVTHTDSGRLNAEGKPIIYANLDGKAWQSATGFDISSVSDMNAFLDEEDLPE